MHEIPLGKPQSARAKQRVGFKTANVRMGKKRRRRRNWTRDKKRQREKRRGTGRKGQEGQMILKTTV